MTAPDFTTATWRTSSYSGSNGGDCVEVAIIAPAVGVRDSKQRDGGQLTLPHFAWQGLLRALPKPYGKPAVDQ